MQTPSKFSLTFLGGAGTVTGANFLLEGPLSSGTPIKIMVDCGMEHTAHFCDQCNVADFSENAISADVLIITHAHMDHIGRIPKLVKDGFKGVIYSTPATRELTEIMLHDSINLIAVEAKRNGIKPLFKEEDVATALSHWSTAVYHEEVSLKEGITFVLKDAGHVLGSAMVEIRRLNKKILFTGDLGNTPAPLLRDTEKITDATYMVMESVYGDRNHPTLSDRTRKLRDLIKRTIQEKGVLLIPAFSIERTQILLYEINNMVEDGLIPQVPVFLDSPLAIKVTDIYKKRIQNFKGSVQEEIKGGDNIFEFPDLHMTLKREESNEIKNVPAPKVIIAGSGMSHGGRILRHQALYLGDPNTTLLFVGYQGAGSLGRKLQDGLRNITIEGKVLYVKAKTDTISGYSAHKGRDDLISFVEDTAETLKTVFVTMGEQRSSNFLAQRLRDLLDVKAIVPKRAERFEIEF